MTNLIYRTFSRDNVDTILWHKYTPSIYLRNLFLLGLLFQEKQNRECRIWASHSGSYEQFYLPGYNAVYISAWHMISRCFLLGLYFDPEEGGDMFLRNVYWLSTEYTGLYPQKTELFKTWNVFLNQVYEACVKRSFTPEVITLLHYPNHICPSVSPPSVLSINVIEGWLIDRKSRHRRCT
jgi:hypothetical protein